MSILNDKLEKIIADSGIDFYKDEIGNELRAKYKLMELSEAIQKMWNSLPDNANIAIYGLGRDAHFLFNEVNLTSKNIVCMIDSDPRLTDFKGYPVIRREDIPEYKIDIVIITSRLYADEMRASVEKASPDCGIMYMWEKLSTMGCVFLEVWTSLVLKDYFYCVFLLNSAILSYSSTGDFKYLLYVIDGYLEFRDLKNALVFIDKYINSDYPDSGKLLALKNSLLDLLGEIKRNLAAKQNPHTLLLISDAMRAIDLTPEQATFLYALGKNNIFCPNAYTHTGWTSTSILTIIRRETCLDNQLYKDVTLKGTDSLFDRLSKSNIDFTYYWSFNTKSLFNNIPEKVKPGLNGCANIIWEYLCSAFENDKKTLSFLHFSETHGPTFCLSHFDNINLHNSAYLDCVRYVDSQTEFLFNLLPDNARLLFCSDHGSGAWYSRKEPQLTYRNTRYNIPYVICDRKTRTGADKRLVSHLDTADILINLLNGRPAFENIRRRILAEVNEEFIYSEKALANYIKLYGRQKIFCAHKCFISKTDKYVISYDGEEGYFLLTDDGTNLINDPKYADRINWFRENVNTEFPDFSDDNGRYDITRKYFDVDKKNTRK